LFGHGNASLPLAAPLIDPIEMRDLGIGIDVGVKDFVVGKRTTEREYGVGPEAGSNDPCLGDIDGLALGNKCKVLLQCLLHCLGDGQGLRGRGRRRLRGDTARHEPQAQAEGKCTYATTHNKWPPRNGTLRVSQSGMSTQKVMRNLQFPGVKRQR